MVFHIAATANPPCATWQTTVPSAFGSSRPSPASHPVAKLPLKPHLRRPDQTGCIVRILGLSFFIGLCASVAPAAFAQQAQFNPTLCEGRTAQDCNDLMGSYALPPE